MSAAAAAWHAAEMLDSLAEVKVREYLRVSQDSSGRERSNTEQHSDNDLVCTRMGWTLDPTPYSDVGSASRFRKRDRPDFTQLIRDLQQGTFGAHILMLWEGSRGSREVPEWWQLLQLLQEQGVLVYITSAYRLFNPRLAQDWLDLMQMAVRAEFEVLQSRERVQRAARADGHTGRWAGGKRPYGYTRVPGVKGLIVNDLEAQHIREAAKRVVKGHSPRKIAADWNTRGVKSATGGLWSPGPLRNLLMSPRLSGQAVMADGSPWPEILTPAQQGKVQAVLQARSPVGRRGRTPWMLTGLLKCGRCGANLMAQTDTRGTRRYVCRKGPGQRGCGGLVVKAEPVEAALVAAVTARLEADQLRQTAPSTEPDPEQVELDLVDAQRAELVRDYQEGLRLPQGHPDRISKADYRLEQAELRRRESEALERRAHRAVLEVAPLDLIADADLVGRPWHELDLGQQRAILEALYVQVTVLPQSRRGSTAFEPDRLQPEWRA